jgi:hypothetical protein
MTDKDCCPCIRYRMIVSMTNMVCYSKGYYKMFLIDIYFTFVLIKNRLKRGKEYDTYLTYVCREPWSIERS